MSLPLLPIECFCNILSFLDNKSLYKCIFVNRYYCKLSIPIIWKDPFIGPNNNSFSLISTLLLCLNEDEISSLIPCAINFNFNFQPPLFEYGKFIRKIDHDFCIKHIKAWLNFSSRRVSVDQDCRVQKLMDAIYHMIMRKGSNLQEFILFIDPRHHVDLPKFSVFTTYNPGITNLNSLDIYDNFDLIYNYVKYQNTIEFLNMVSKICNRIVSCELWVFRKLNSEILKPLLDIIKLQPLKKILLFIGDHLIDRVMNTQKILYFLEFRSETLKELSFDSFDFQQIDLSFISKLKCLEHLIFMDCYGFTLKHYETLSKKELHLKELKFWYDDNYDYRNVTLLVSIINSLCGKALLKLSLNIITPEIVKTVKESCPNINFLCVEYFSVYFSNSIIPLICELSSLKILHIKVYDDIDKLIVRILSNHLISVEYLFLDFYIDLLSFEYFINNCRSKMKKLNILVYENLRINYLIHVNNFQIIHNSLKVLGIEKYGNWTKEEIEIVNLLKNQGVDVVSSNELNYLFC